MAGHGCKSPWRHDGSDCMGHGAVDVPLGLVGDGAGLSREPAVVIIFAEDFVKLFCLVWEIE